MKEVLDQIPGKIQKLIERHKGDIEQAFSMLADDEALNISLSSKIYIKKGKKLCDVDIGFIKEKVKDSLHFSWDDAPLLKGAVDLPDADKGNTFYNKKAGKKEV